MTIDKAFMEKHDFDWSSLKFEGGYPPEGELVHGCRQVYPRGWNDGAFLGNGMIGAMIYKDTPQVLRWELGRSDVTAGNFLKDIDWAIPRVPIGDVLLTPVGRVQNETMHLDLWSARAYGTVTTDAGEIRWNSMTLRNRDVLVIELETTGEESGCVLGFRPRHGVSPRIRFAPQRLVRAGELPPPPLQERRGETDISTQTFLTETGAKGSGELREQGACCVARREWTTGAGKRVFAAAITNSPSDKSCVDRALSLVDDLSGDSPDTLAYEKAKEEHTSWWQAYYSRAGIAVNDGTWETFYWRQVYKQACANRPDGVVLDSQGPWLTDTTWPTTVWNLNVQLCYTPLYTANRVDLARPLGNLLLQNREQLRDSARDSGFERGILVQRATSPRNFSPSGNTYEVGNLTWALFCLWTQFEVTGDKGFLKETLYPLMTEHLEIYKQLVTPGDDGFWHIPRTSSPEYPSKPNTNWSPIEDCNYTLALFKWLLDAMDNTEKLLKLTGDDLSWRREAAEKLVPFPEDERGFRIGKDIPYSVSHRHYSHLFMIYPLHLLDLADETNRARTVKSVETWIGTKGRLQGYSFTGAANMAAALGMGDRALEYLNGLMEYVHPNTMYSESGPVIETPLSAMESIHYMLMQSWSGIIEIFPALPDSWTEASFDRLLARGAFEVSARRTKGKTEEVRITSLAGNPLQVRPGFHSENDSSHVIFNPILKKGETLVFSREYPRGKVL